MQEYRHEDWGVIVDSLNRELYAHLQGTAYAERIPPLDAFLEVVSRGLQERRAESASTLRSHGVADVLEAVFREYGLEGERVEEYLAPWYRHLTGITYLRPDVEPTLRLLRGGGLKLGVVSNTGWPASVHDPDLDRFGIKDLFDCRLYSCEVGWEKPAPQIFMAALDCMGLRAEETAFVGDFLKYDVAGAQAVGMRGIWKRVDGRPAEADDMAVVPDAVIESIGEVPAALEQLYGWRG